MIEDESWGEGLIVDDEKGYQKRDGYAKTNCNTAASSKPKASDKSHDCSKKMAGQKSYDDSNEEGSFDEIAIVGNEMINGNAIACSKQKASGKSHDCSKKMAGEKSYDDLNEKESSDEIAAIDDEMGVLKCPDDLMIFSNEVFSCKESATMKSHDALMSWDDDGLEVEGATMAKNCEDAISISSGSSEDAVLIEDCGLKQKARKTSHGALNDLKKPSSKKMKFSLWNNCKQEGWSLIEEHDEKEEGFAKIDEMEKCSFVRSHHSNARETYVECCAHEKCCKKHKIARKSNSMKWCMLVNDQEHTNIMKKCLLDKID